jgi:hypothetical protein
MAALWNMVTRPSSCIGVICSELEPPFVLNSEEPTLFLPVGVLAFCFHSLSHAYWTNEYQPGVIAGIARKIQEG